MIPERGRSVGRRTDVDDGDYIDLFLDDGYDDELARDDTATAADESWPQQGVAADWLEAPQTDPDLRA